MATWIPTPDRNPVRTVRDRKSEKNPRRMMRAMKSKAAAIRASIPASATYSVEPEAAMPASPAASIAAVAESAPTTKCRDEPKIANKTIGVTMV
jgi:hypothetical protein